MIAANKVEIAETELNEPESSESRAVRRGLHLGQRDPHLPRHAAHRVPQRLLHHPLQVQLLLGQPGIGLQLCLQLLLLVLLQPETEHSKGGPGLSLVYKN